MWARGESRLRAFAAKLRGLLSGQPRDDGFDDEIQEHVRLLADRFVAQGMSREEAARAARRQFGNTTLLQEDRRDMQTFPSVEAWWRDVRYALRLLRKSPGYTSIAMLTLAIGIGANSAIFSFVDGVLLKPLPYPDSDRIVRVMEKPPERERNTISTLNFLDWQRDNTVFDFLAAERGGGTTLTGVSEPVQLRGARVSADYFRLFRTEPALGRTFAPGEDQLGNHRVVILSHALWISQFGADPSIVNRPILLDNQQHTVIGVLPKGSAFDRAFTQIWRPLAFEPSNMTRDYHWLVAFGRLKQGVSLEQAQSAMSALGARIATEFPASNKGWGVIVERYADTLIGPDMRRALLVLMAATGLVLLIGCANLANLALTRGLSREREVVVRASLGAGRGVLIRQFLTEHVLLSVCGGALGLAVGYGLMRAMLTLLPPFSFAREVAIEMDVRVLTFAMVVAISTGILFGLVPAIQATRPDLAAAMKDDNRSSSGSLARRRLRDTLIVAEVALAFVLLVGAGLMMRSFFRLMNVDAGFDSTNLLTMRLPMTTDQFPDPDHLNRYLGEVRAAVEALPGVRGTAYSCAPPMQGACYGMPMQIANRPAIDRDNYGGFFKVVSPSYFSTLGIRVVKGRALSNRDTRSSPPVLIINERLARRYFGDQDPIGQHILIQEIVPGKRELGSDISWEVVGMIGDEKIGGPADDESAGVYVSHEQSPYYGMVLSVRARIDPLTLPKAITAAIHSVRKDQAIIDVRTVDQIRDLAMADRRLQSVLLSVFGAVALVLAGLGVYGVISYSVAQRTREMGIRAAMGASKSSLLRLVFRRAAWLTAVGLALGMAGASALTGLMGNLLYNVSPRDPATMTAVAFTLAAVAGLASYVPARRATNIDSVVALRYE